jgi:hypothetical protein
MNPLDQPTPTLAPTPRTDAEQWETVDEARCFARTLERALTAAKAECYLHRNRLASIFWSGAIDKRTCREVQQWDDDYTAELTRLRAEVERLKDHAFDKDGTPWKTVCGWWSKKYDAAERNMMESAARAEKAEAERDALAKDKARLDWLKKNWIHWPITQNEETNRAAIAAAMKGTP